MESKMCYINQAFNYLICVSEAAIRTWRDHGTHEIEAADTTRSVKWILSVYFYGKTVRMTEFRWYNPSIWGTAINIRLVG